MSGAGPNVGVDAVAQAVETALLPGITRSQQTSAASIAIFSSLLIWHSPLGMGAWLVLRVLTTAGCMVVLKRMTRGRLASRNPIQTLTLLMAVSGVVWGLLALFVQPADPEWRAVVVVWIFGNQSVVTAVCAASKPVFRAAAGSVTVFGAVSMLATGGDFSLVLAGLIVLGGLYAASVFTAMHRVAIGAIKARLTATELAASLDELARRDSLTGLANRRAFMASSVDRDRAADGRLQRWIGIVDIDDFKRINDSLGHAAGDEVLVEVARRWQAVMPKGALIARIGGDEFAVAFDAESESEAQELGEHLGELVRRPISLSSGDVVDVTCSVGVVMTTSDEALSGCMARADAALYDVKRSGRNGVQVRGAVGAPGME